MLLLLVLLVFGSPLLLLSPLLLTPLLLFLVEGGGGGSEFSNDLVTNDRYRQYIYNQIMCVLCVLLNTTSDSCILSVPL